MNEVVVRGVRPDDAGAIAAIYAPYVRDTTITFEEEAPNATEIGARIARVTATHPWLVVERGGAVVGYAYGYPYRTRAAYRWVAEVGIYLAAEAHGGGLGTRLYAALLKALEDCGYVAAIGVVTVPNPPSEALHRKLGFADRGTQPGIGYKHGRWCDVAFWQKDFGRPAMPAEPVPAGS